MSEEFNQQSANGKPKTKNKWGVYIPMILVIILVLVGVYYWYKEYTRYITTDDAYIDADNVSLTPKIMGRIITLNADEGDSVKSGALLAVLDSSDLLSQKKQVIAQKEQAIAQKEQSEAKYEYDKESIKVLEVNYDKTKDDFDRAKEQFKGGVITQEQNDHAQKAFEAAQAQIEAAKSQLNVSKAATATATATVQSIQAQINVIETSLKNTKIYSPMDGLVAKRWLLPGDVVQPGQSILTITNNHKHWVLVFLEETKLSGLHIGQNARFTIDAFDNVRFKGKIYQLGSNTASLFSLIPPNNASGNFTKVTQRVPIKISIDGTDNNTKLSDYKLLAGMSAVVKIIR